MHPVVTFVASAFVVALSLWAFQVLRRLKPGVVSPRSLGFVMMTTGVALFFVRAVAVAVPFVIVGISLALASGSRPVTRVRTRTSQVRSAHLEMTLDHETGKIDGRILTGKHEGEVLSDLTLEEVLQVYSEVEDDRDSARLLEAFLDRSHPEWRQHGEKKRKRSSGKMTREQAYELLGLEVGADEDEVREAYHRLIKRVHPDHGGCDALTAQVTEARNTLLGKKE